MYAFNDQVVLDGWLRVIQRTFTDGPLANKQRIIIEDVDSVGVLLVRGRQVYVVHQFRAALNRMTWEIPAGCMDKTGESAVETMARELQEETGYEVNPGDLSYLPKSSFVPYIGASNEVQHLYVCRIAEDVPQAEVRDDAKADGVATGRWVDLMDFIQLGNQGEYLCSKTVIAQQLVATQLLRNNLRQMADFLRSSAHLMHPYAHSLVSDSDRLLVTVPHILNLD